jgi:hypothetical protein
MKKIAAIIVIVIAVLSAKAQTTYDTCNYLSRYAGEWMYANGQDTIRIYLRPHRSFSPNFNDIIDNLCGWHEYKRGNTIIESNYQYRHTYLPYTWVSDSVSVTRYSVLLTLRECDPVGNTLGGIIVDLSQAREPKVVNAIIAGITMTWKQRHGEGYGAFTGAYGMTLPKEFILVKQ